MADKTQGNPTTMFVYGTLRSNQVNNPALEGAELVGPAFLSGQFRIVELGWFPGVQRREKGDKTIYGELYTGIDRDTLEYIDGIEGHPSFYERRKLTVRTLDGKKVKAWVYLHPGGDGLDITDTGGWRLSEEEKKDYDKFTASRT